MGGFGRPWWLEVPNATARSPPWTLGNVCQTVSLLVGTRAPRAPVMLPPLCGPGQHPLTSGGMTRFTRGTVHLSHRCVGFHFSDTCNVFHLLHLRPSCVSLITCHTRPSSRLTPISCSPCRPVIWCPIVCHPFLVLGPPQLTCSYSPCTTMMRRNANIYWDFCFRGGETQAGEMGCDGERD